MNYLRRQILTGEIYPMSEQEITRTEIIEKILAKRLSLKAGAELLNLSTRQLIRLKQKYVTFGATALISKRRGKPSNRQYSESYKQKILAIIQENYHDFGPTFAGEKLLECHKLTISKETLRKWMMEIGLWSGKSRKIVNVHQQRARRVCRGELVQIDGSPHAWFEDRGPKCCLLVFIDDATSELLQLHFCEVESANAYFDSCKLYLKRHGRPMAFYSDKHSIFRINIPEAKDSTGESQFGRAMRELGIELICANTPQAKGRVEMANSTLQDRLVKELRLNNICDIESANTFLPTFIKDYNTRFAKTPTSSIDMHRASLPDDGILDLIFSHQHLRKLSKNLELSYNNKIYQIKTDGKGYRMRRSIITVHENSHQKITLRYKNQLLDYQVFDKNNRPAPIIDTKTIDQHLKKNKLSSKKTYKPKPEHPWRNYPNKNQKSSVAA